MSLRRLLAISRKEVFQVLRDSRSLLIVLLMPLMLMTTLGYGVNLDTQPDLEAFGLPYGMHCAAVSDPAHLGSALDDAVAAVEGGRTAIINVYVTK